MANRKVLADTSILIEFLRKQNKQNSILWRLKDDGFKVFVSSVSLFEIYFGATTPKHQKEADTLFETLEIVDFQVKEAKKSAEIMRKLKLSNKMIEFRDVFIAASAIVHKLKLITLNKSDFERIDGLEFFEL